MLLVESVLELVLLFSTELFLVLPRALEVCKVLVVGFHA
jgi:hypothetical protein